MFHQPVQSVATYRLLLSRQSGASTDSRLLPLISRAFAGAPLSSGATRNSVPSHGMCGWFQQIQASHRPSGDGVGKAKKSAPSTRVRIAPWFSAADPSRGTATMALVTLPAWYRSCTHQTSGRPGASAKSAYRRPADSSAPAAEAAGTAVGSGVSGIGTAGEAAS